VSAVIVGVTGCVGAGKSTVCAALARRGWSVLDVDVLVREALHELGGTGGDLLARALSDPAERARWAARLRPRVGGRIEAWAAALEGPGALESALLFEEGLDAFCSATLCVTCEGAERRRRVERRSSTSASQFDAIEAAQWSEAAKVARADVRVSSVGALLLDDALLALGRARLGRRWSASAARAGATEDSAAAFAALCVRYAEPHRAYHTLAHVAACLDALDDAAPSAAHGELVELAIYYHDAVYDPRAADNEARSAALASTQLRALGVPAGAARRVHELVLATRTHEATDSLAALVVDADLSILGAGADDFAAFEQAIRREYAFVPGLLYRRRRRRVLERFLARPAIYRTDAFSCRYEARARVNLAAAIARLS
jgi:predicted metal-dependent HD superfamily phosphohydrolase/dephospho-CoA kinase